MKLIISESAEKRLIAQLVKEEMVCLADKVGLVKQFLDKNFLKASNSVIGDNGRPSLKDIVIMVDAYKQPKQYMSDVDLFYLLQDEFKDILPPDEVEQVEDIVNDEFNDAYKEAERQVKAVTHNKRDKFLKQCIKDWYYNKISKNNNLSIYEAIDNNDSHNNRTRRSTWNFENKDYLEQIQRRLEEPHTLRTWDDVSDDGHEVLPDLNFLLKGFKIKMNRPISPYERVNDTRYGDDNPDLFYLLQTILYTRAAFKWYYLCPNLIPSEYKVDYQYFNNEVKGKYLNSIGINSMGRPNYCFRTMDDRKKILPFYGEQMKKCFIPFKNSELYTEVQNATELNGELNTKIENYLDSVGFPSTGIDVSQLTYDDDFSNFEEY